MQIEITISQMLLYNDLPEIFLGKDKVETNYIFLLVNIDNDIPEYVSVGISHERFNHFLNKYIDLRTIFKEPELGIWYKTINFTEEKVFIEMLDVKEISEDYLPEKDFYINEYLTEEENKQIKEEANVHSNTIIHLSLSDEQNKNEIDTNILSLFVDHFQNLVKNTFKKVISLEKNKDYDNENNYKLKAFAVSQGSFKLHLKAIAQLDLFNNSAIDIALKKLDDMTFQRDNENELLEVLQPMKGHSIKSFKKLVQSIDLKKVELTYEWYSLSEERSHKRKIDKKYAKKILQLLNNRSELSKELIEFTGNVKQVDTDKGKWRIFNLEDEKEYSGSSKGELLKGIIMETGIYKFICEELIEENHLNHNEIVRYKLLEIEFINN